jgi:hypothetical protein
MDKPRRPPLNIYYPGEGWRMTQLPDPPKLSEKDKEFLRKYYRLQGRLARGEITL